MTLEIEKDNTSNLLEILNNYEENYHNKLITLSTAYKQLETIQIPFHNNNFPHLIGLHKVDDSNAKKQIQGIKNEEITYESIQDHHNFNNIKDRIINIDFLDRVFIKEEIKECIQVSDFDRGNRMNLDIVFLEKGLNKVMTFGLRKNKRKENFFIPTTFYVSRDKNTYNRSKRITIENIEWS